MKSLSFAALFLLVTIALAQNKTASTQAATAPDFAAFANRYFDDYYFKFNPTQGTAAGFHQYDNQLEDYSRASIDKQIMVLNKFKAEFATRYAKGGDSVSASIDRTLVANDINARLLALESIRQWEKNPDVYSGGVTNSIFVIMARTFAPPEQRLQSVIAREKQIPAVFQAAKQNLKNPPPIYVDIALEQVPGIIGFFQKDVPEAFTAVKDQKLLDEFHSANQKVMDALKHYQEWLEKDLKPRAHGDFRIGAANFSKKLLYDEMVDIPLDPLAGDRHGQPAQEPGRSSQKYRAKIDPSKTPQQILDELEKDHPPPTSFCRRFRDTLGGLRDLLGSTPYRDACRRRCCPS